jgi:epoxyqueuosine reductase
MDWFDAAWVMRATDPATFVDGAQTVVVLAQPCHVPDPEIPGGDTRTRGRVARYARGRDYHRLFEKRLRRIARRIREELGAAARASVDYGPILERPYGALAGLGWVGKSTMLLAPGYGPWVLLGVVVTTLEVEPDRALKKSCGSCVRCAVACPTGALGPDGAVLASRLCISYHTIENRGVIPRELRARFGDWVFGCDACLDSCPVGARQDESHPDFVAKRVDDAFPPLSELLEVTGAEFESRFRGRAIARAKRDGMARNACIALGNVGGADDLPALERALVDDSPLVRGHAAWAVGRLASRGVLPGATACGALEPALTREQDPWVREELRAALDTARQGAGYGDR